MVPPWSLAMSIDAISPVTDSSLERVTSRSLAPARWPAAWRPVATAPRVSRSWIPACSPLADTGCVLLFGGAALVGQPSSGASCLSGEGIVAILERDGLGLPCRLGLVVGRGPQPDLPTGDEQGPRCEGVEQGAVVGHHHAGSLERLEGVLEEPAAIAIEVVRRLVEQEDVWLLRQRRGDLPALSLARGHRRPSLEVATVEGQRCPETYGVAVPRFGEAQDVVGDVVDPLGTHHRWHAVRVDGDRARVWRMCTGDE